MTDHPNSPAMSVIVEIAAERRRQIEKGWTPDHDDDHGEGEMAYAAAAYAAEDDRPDWKPPHAWVRPGKSHRQNCVIACALLVAEIERIDRAEAKAFYHVR